jgi:HEPN domain-containing protein
MGVEYPTIMLDVNKQIEYWRQGADEDWHVAAKLVKDGSGRHGLFFAHLALEKVLKGLVCRRTQDVPPRIHNLMRLSELAGLAPNDDQMELLADMNQFNLEGRYPESYALAPSPEEAARYLARSQEVLAWLTQQF